MYWVVQNNIYSEEGHTRLVEALERRNLPYSLHKCVPFSDTLDPDVFPAEGPVIVMGSYRLANVARLRGWAPGAFINDNLNYIIQLEHWGEAMLNADASVHKIGEVPEQIQPFFIRPIHDSKAFVGQVIDWPTFVEWKERVLALTPEDTPTMDKDTEVMVCTNKEIYNETRTWIIDEKVVTASRYKGGTIKQYSEMVDPEVIHFAEYMAKQWSPIRAYVLDVAITEKGPRIVEVNNLNSSGFYKADMGRLIDSLEYTFGGEK